MAKMSKKNSQINDCWNAIGVWSFSKEKCEKLSKYIHCRNCPIFSKAGHSVFENKPPVGYLSEWRKEIASEINKAELKPNSVLVFRIGDEWFAFPANILCEIANKKSIHRIPRNLNNIILGIVNINGEIKVCYSLGNLLEMKDIDYKQDTVNVLKRLIVIELDKYNYVFPVDEVKGLDWYSDSDLLPLPSTLKSAGNNILAGSIKKSGRQIAIFNVEKFKDQLEGISS